jgi:hypothetical protein
VLKELIPDVPGIDAPLNHNLKVALTQIADAATRQIDFLAAGEAAAATTFNAAVQAAVDEAKGFITAKYNAATVTALDPATGPAAGGTLVTLTGTNFLSVYEVAFGAEVVPVGEWKIVSNTEIVVFLSPAQAAGTVNVRVRNAVGQSATAAGNEFIYT